MIHSTKLSVDWNHYYKSSTLQALIDKSNLPAYAQQPKTIQSILALPIQLTSKKRKSSITAKGKILTNNDIIEELENKKKKKKLKKLTFIMKIILLKRNKIKIFFFLNFLNLKKKFLKF